jgi:hypothetical protein
MLASLVDSSFLLIAGEEVTASFEKKPVHVNGLNIPGVIEPDVHEKAFWAPEIGQARE